MEAEIVSHDEQMVTATMCLRWAMRAPPRDRASDTGRSTTLWLAMALAVGWTEARAIVG